MFLTLVVGAGNDERSTAAPFVTARRHLKRARGRTLFPDDCIYNLSSSSSYECSLPWFILTPLHPCGGCYYASLAHPPTFCPLLIGNHMSTVSRSLQRLFACSSASVALIDPNTFSASSIWSVWEEAAPRASVWEENPSQLDIIHPFYTISVFVAFKHRSVPTQKQMRKLGFFIKP